MGQKDGRKEKKLKKKKYSGETRYGQGPWEKRYTWAFSPAQAEKNLRVQHRKTLGLEPTAFIAVENIREEK